MQVGDAEHRVVDAVAFQPTVAKDLPRLHAGEDVLDTGPDLLVGLVVRLLPGRQFLVLRVAAMWDDQPCSPVAAVGDGGRGADGGLGTGLAPGPAVVAVTGQGLADHDDQAGVGVDDHLVIGGVAVVLRLLCNLVVSGGYQRAVDDEHRIPAEPLPGLQRQQRAGAVDDAIGRRLRDPKQWGKLAQGQVGAPVRRDQQHPILQRKAPRPAPAACVVAVTSQLTHQLAKHPRAQPGKRGYPRRLRRRDHTRHRKIISAVASGYGTAFSHMPVAQRPT